MFTEMTAEKERSPPQWQVIALVAIHLDPKSLALASCVCKLWFISMSSDHLWRPICNSRYPSLAALRRADPVVPYRKLYSLGATSDTRRRRIQPPPLLSMSNLIFSITVSHQNSPLATVVRRGSELAPDAGDKSSVFRFTVDAGGGAGGGSLAGIQALRDLRVTWDAVLEGYKSKFTVLECEGGGNFVSGLEGWYSKELPPPCCCSNDTVSGLVADLRLGFKLESGGRRIVVENISLGLLNIVSWRYVQVVDTLRYLQHFLLL